jgi:XTP/dITP diphosphohydrolase
MTCLVLATRNAHKVGEIRQILGAETRLLSQTDFPGAPAAAENAATFAGNAAKKAEGLSAWLADQTLTEWSLKMLLCNEPTSRPADALSPQSRERAGRGAAETFFVLADDSGLEVDALGGAPGVHSARFAAADASGGNSPDAANNAKLLRLLDGIPPEKRGARFRCVLALAAPGRKTILFEGSCEGRISTAPGGAGGFGYDPLFVPEGRAQSFAELGEEVKNKISHRARALAQLRLFLDGVSQGVEGSVS